MDWNSWFPGVALIVIGLLVFLVFLFFRFGEKKSRGLKEGNTANDAETLVLTRPQAEEFAELLSLPAAKVALRFKGTRLGEVDSVLPELLSGAKKLLYQALEEHYTIIEDQSGEPT